MTSNLVASSGGVDAIGVALEIGLEVAVLGEASLEGTIVHQLGLEFGDILGLQGLVALGGVGLRPLGATVALAVVALGGGTVVGVIRSTPVLAQAGAGSITVFDHPVPSNGRVTTITPIPGALEDRFGGHDGARGGLTGDTGAIGEGLHRSKVPARTTMTLVKDLPLAVAPLGTSIEAGGDIGRGQRHKGEDKKKCRAHDVFLSLSRDE